MFILYLARLIDLLSCGPARVFNLDGGTLAAGALGDVTIVDPGAKWDVPKAFRSMSSNSPFVGMSLQGRPVATLVGGVVKYDARAGSAAPKKRVKR